LVRFLMVKPTHPSSSPQLGTSACIFLNLLLVGVKFMYMCSYGWVGLDIEPTVVYFELF
jgi:hypothetical protein